MIKDVYNTDDNPNHFKSIKIKTKKALIDYKSRIKITLDQNIFYVCYGRTVGYKMKKLKCQKK